MLIIVVGDQLERIWGRPLEMYEIDDVTSNLLMETTGKSYRFWCLRQRDLVKLILRKALQQ